MEQCKIPNGRRTLIDAAGRTAYVSVASRVPIAAGTHPQPNRFCRIKSLIAILHQNKDTNDDLPVVYRDEFTCTVCNAYVYATIELIRPNPSDSESSHENYYPNYKFPSE